MGQYHYPVNWDKYEYIYPHAFGDGLKLLEFGASGCGTMLGLAVLLASSNTGGARGGGDLHPWRGGHWAESDRENPEIVSAEYEQRLMDLVVGRWAGDRVSILGDYHEDYELPAGDSPWRTETEHKFTDISGAVIQTMCLDYYTRQEFDKGPSMLRLPVSDQELVADDGKITPQERDDD